MPATPHCRFLKPTLFAVPTLLASTFTVSAENPGAHQHGYAELQMAFSGQTVELRALSPTYNLLGFEHEPRTEAQHQTVDSALHWLEDTPLINTAGAACLLEHSEVVYAYAEGNHKDSDHDGHDDHHDDHEDHHNDHDGHDDHNHHDEHSHDKHEDEVHSHSEHDHAEHDEEAHSDIEVIQTLNCSDLNADTQLISQFSDRFPALEHLNIQWSGPEGQGALRLEQGESRFQLTR